MRANTLFWALAAAIAVPAGLAAQDTGRVLSHNSTEAVNVVLAHQDMLQLNDAQLDQLRALQTRFDRQQTRVVMVSWRGAPGKSRTPRYERVPVPAGPERYVETRTIARIRSFDRVPGKTVPRIQRTRVTRLVDPPCPFSFLADNQLELVHELLARI